MQLFVPVGLSIANAVKVFQQKQDKYSLIYLEPGTHVLAEQLLLNMPIKIVGAGRDQTFVKGGSGFKIEEERKKKERM